MLDRDAFSNLIQRVQSGESEAAAELVRLHETEIRRFIRYRLASASLSTLFESLDIWQSVMARFFVHLDAGKLDLDEPVKLRKLLMTMARNKVYDQVRHENADRRDRKKMGGWSNELLDSLAGAAETPSQIVSRQEIVSLIRASLSDEEAYLLDQRASGQSWDALAAELDSRPDALRKRLVRAVDRVANELGFCEGAT